MNNALEHKINRRQFMTRSAKAGVSIVAACSISYWFYDSAGPTPSTQDTSGVQIPDFSMPQLGQRMSIVRGNIRSETLELALKSIGGIQAFIKKGDRVLLKVNAAFASPPMLSATTHPEMVSALTRLCLNAGAASVTVTDNPINDPASCFRLTGIEKAARSAGATVTFPQKEFFKPFSLAEAQLIRNWPVLYDPLSRIDKIIGTAPVKDHHRSGASMIMKNWYGLLGGRRNIFHQDIHTIIKELAMMIKPTLVVLDGTTTMMRNGPTGGSLSDLKETHTMIVSTDQVAADAFGATLLGKTVDELAFIKKAEAMKLGTADFQSLNPVMESI
ncbi:MAG: DUF362 domain-containing protein [Desulfobacterales bacterium]|jgi:uncharacterized protein (DUF362 family)